MLKWVLTIAKAIAAVGTTLVTSGLVTGHWLTETELVVSVCNGAAVWLVPNLKDKVLPPSANAVRIKATE
jgi:hypothetical protein